MPHSLKFLLAGSIRNAPSHRTVLRPPTRRLHTKPGVAVGVVAALALLATTPAHAGDWPEHPIKLVVPYPPGGLTDIVSRVVSEEVGKALGTSVVVENKPGAGGQIGLQSVLQAPKDGTTIALVVPATMVTLPLTNANYKIKPLEQFEPITIAVDTFVTLAVSPKLGVRSLAEFSALARKTPGAMNYGTPGTGTSFHFNNVVLAQKLGMQTVHVPYKGESEVLNDLASGQLQYALVSNAAKPFIDSGQIVPLAVAAPQRVAPLPAVPTFKEAGVDFHSDGWVGYVAPAGTPAAIIAKLHAAFAKALALPAIQQKFAAMGYSVVANSPSEFRATVADNTKRYAELLRSGVVKLDK